MGESEAQGRAEYWRLPYAALKDSRVSKAAVVYLLWLVDRAGDEGDSWWSLAKAGEDLGWSRAAVTRARAELVEAGYVSIKKNQGCPSTLILAEPGAFLSRLANDSGPGSKMSRVVNEPAHNRHPRGSKMSQPPGSKMSHKPTQENLPKEPREGGARAETPPSPNGHDRAQTKTAERARATLAFEQALVNGGLTTVATSWLPQWNGGTPAERAQLDAVLAEPDRWPRLFRALKTRMAEYNKANPGKRYRSDWALQYLADELVAQTIAGDARASPDALDDDPEVLEIQRQFREAEEARRHGKAAQHTAGAAR